MVERERTSIPGNDGHILNISWPAKTILFVTELLQLHRQLTLLDFVIREDLQVAGKSEQGVYGNEPLGRVVLVPLDRIPVVHGELVMEVVVTFTDGNERGDNMVAGRVLVVKWSVTEIMRKGVHAESRLRMSS